jgi:hypothetical protein
MSDRGAGATGSVVSLEPKAKVKPEANDPLERAGHLILDMIGKAASTAEVNYQQAVEMSRKLSTHFEVLKIGYESLRHRSCITRTERTGPRDGCIKSRWTLSRNSLAETIVARRNHLLHKQFPEISRARLLRIAPVLIVT